MKQQIGIKHCEMFASLMQDAKLFFVLVLSLKLLTTNAYVRVTPLGGLVDVAIYQELDDSTFHNLNWFLYQIRANVVLYYSSRDQDLKLAKDETVNKAIIIFHTNDSKDLENTKLKDGETLYSNKYIWIISYNHLNQRAFKLPFPETSFTSKHWLIVMAHSTLILHLSLSRQGLDLKSGYVFENEKYRISAILEDKKTKEYDAVNNLEELSLDGEIENTITETTLFTGTEGFQFRYKCAKPHACIQRYSLQRYYPSDLEVRLSHQYTLVNSTNKGSINVSLGSWHSRDLNLSYVISPINHRTIESVQLERSKNLSIEYDFKDKKIRNLTSNPLVMRILITEQQLKSDLVANNVEKTDDESTNFNKIMFDKTYIFLDKEGIAPYEVLTCPSALELDEVNDVIPIAYHPTGEEDDYDYASFYATEGEYSYDIYAFSCSMFLRPCVCGVVVLWWSSLMLWK